MRKIAIVGSRDFNNYETMKSLLKENNIHFYSDDIIISGGARGADTLAEKFAKEFNLEFMLFPANWEKYSKRAGYIRNEEMAKEADIIIAFWRNNSRGTKHMIDLSKNNGKEVIIL